MVAGITLHYKAKALPREGASALVSAQMQHGPKLDSENYN